MNSIAPWHPCRSEAFAEDLFGDSTQAEPADRSRSPRVLNTLLLCAVPLVVALLGGVVAFLQTV